MAEFGRRAWFRSRHVCVTCRFFILPAKILNNFIFADMAELADAYGSGPYESDFMQVQVLLSAPAKSQILSGFFYYSKAEKNWHT